MNLDIKIEGLISPGTQKARYGILMEIAEQVRTEDGVNLISYNTLVAEDPNSEPTFMYSFDTYGTYIYRVAFGDRNRNEIDVGEWDIDVEHVKTQIREAIKSLST